MSIGSSVGLSNPTIIVVGTDDNALETLQAQIELRGLHGQVELIVGDLPDVTQLRTLKPELVIWHGPARMKSESLCIDQFPILLIGDVDPTDWPGAAATLQLSYDLMDMINIVGRFVDLPWPHEILGSVHSQEELGDAEHRYRDLFERGGDAILLIEKETHIIIDANQAAQELYGYDRDEFVGMYMLTIANPSEHVAIYRNARSLGSRRTKSNSSTKRLHLKKDGTPIIVTVNATVLPYGKYNIFQDIIRDETERFEHEAQLEKLIEERTRELVREQDKLRQAQKMEAIGQLTGGIAHDFNNLLTIILGNLEMLSIHQTDDARAARLLKAASSAAQRGAQLTNQLLSFARQQPLAPEVINVNDLIIEMSDMLKRSLGETIELSTALDADLGRTFVDPVQLHNALLNLTINARDAMPQGGRLTIETSNVDLDADEASLRADAEPGNYVRLSVSDTGTGMSPEVRARVLEPFFTTKEQGKGTGLGLSMVHGFAKQSGGHVDVYSEVGYGTSISLYLPDADEEAASRETINAQFAVGEGKHNETVLVVEDDPSVRDIAVARLDHLGYQVVEAENGQQALEVLAQGKPVDVLLTDMVMPGGMTGSELAEQVRAAYPETKVILTSGYANHGTMPNDGTPWLRKPYSLADLAQTLRKLLDP